MSEGTNGADAAFDAARAATRGCERAEDFVTHLYGEATPEESKAFRLHLDACAACREELAALGTVREGLGVWRAEALGSVPSLDISSAFAAQAVATRASGRGRSASAALAALREFFSLSPLWMRAGAFAAALAVCATAALVLARAEVRWDAEGLALRTGVREGVVTRQAPAPAPPAQGSTARENLYTEEQLRAAVEREVAEATERLKEQRQERRPEKVVNVSDRVGKSRARDAAPNTLRRRRAAGRADSLLAEDNLPRLSDLLEGSYED